MQISPIATHTNHYKRPSNRLTAAPSPLPKQQFSGWNDNTTLRDILVMLLLLVGVNGSESGFNNRAPEFKLGETELVGPKQGLLDHLWNGVKGTFTGGTQAERVEIEKTQGQINEIAALETLKLLKEQFKKDHPNAPEGAWEKWQTEHLTPKIKESLKGIGITLKPDAPKVPKDEVSF